MYISGVMVRAQRAEPSCGFRETRVFPGAGAAEEWSGDLGFEVGCSSACPCEEGACRGCRFRKRALPAGGILNGGADEVGGVSSVCDGHGVGAVTVRGARCQQGDTHQSGQGADDSLVKIHEASPVNPYRR